VTGFAPGVVATEMWEQVDQDLLEIGACGASGAGHGGFSAGILKGRVATPRTTSPEQRRSWLQG
jgi:meso-butanediol dehydrogenase/(S,S)-butanediol dehydrogenase/diacetyl reductase